MTSTTSTATLTKADAHFKHVRKCKHHDDCATCRDGVEFLNSLPPNQINQILSDVTAPRRTFKFSSIALESLIDRTKENIRNGKPGKRVDADCKAAYAALAGFKKRGNKIF